MTTGKMWRQKGILWGCITSLLVLGNTDAEARRKKKNTSNNTAGVTQFVSTQNTAGSNNATAVPFLAPQNASLTQEAGLGWCRKTTAMLNHKTSGTIEDFNFVTVVEQLRDPQTNANEQFRGEVIRKLPKNVQQLSTQTWDLPANAAQLDESMCRTVRDCLVTIFNQQQILEGGAYDHSLVTIEAYVNFVKWCGFIVKDGLKGLKKEIKEPLAYISQNLYVQNAQDNRQPQEVNEQAEFLLALLLQRLDDIVLMYEFADIKTKLEPVAQTLANSQVNWTITGNEIRLATILTKYLYGQINSFLANRQLRELIDSGALSSPLTDWLRWGARLIMAPFPDGQNLGWTLLQTILTTMLPALNAMAANPPASIAGNAPATNQTNLPDLQLPRMTIHAPQGLSATSPVNNADLSKLLATVQNPQSAVNLNTVSRPPLPATGQVIALGGSTNSAPNPLTTVAPSYANQSAYANQNQLLAALLGYGAGTNPQNQNQPQKNQPQQNGKNNDKGPSITVNDINSILKTLNSFRQPITSN